MNSKFALSFIAGILMLSGAVFAAAGLEGIVQAAKDIGVFQFYLPFILVFAIILGLLQKVKVFGENKQLNVIIALVVAAYVAVFTPVGITFGQFLTSLFGNAIVVIITFVIVALFFAVLQGGGLFEFKGFKGVYSYWVVLLLFALIIFGVFVASGGTAIFPGLKVSPTEWLSPVIRAFGMSSTTLALIILIVGTGLIVWWFAKPEAGKVAEPKKE